MNRCNKLKCNTISKYFNILMPNVKNNSYISNICFQYGPVMHTNVTNIPGCELEIERVPLSQMQNIHAGV